MPLSQLPEVSEKRLAVRLTPDALRQVRAGHPWIYDGSIESISGGSDGGRSGDLAVVFDDKRKFAAIGLYDPDSPIMVKVLHRGRPRQIDSEFWRDAVAKAIALRSSIDNSETTAFRCINGENDGFPGLVLDRYADTLVLKLYSRAWLPHLRDVVTAVVELLSPETIILRFGRAALDGPTFGLDEGSVIHGPAPDGPVEFLENGLRFEADLIEGQKTGHFLDQRDNRALVQGMASGARVLDVFSCTGGFSVHAAAGGATFVLSVDQSPQAIAGVDRNFALNAADERIAACRRRTEVGDAFVVMEELAAQGERFDIVVIDPPSFAQRQESIDGALRAYMRLTNLGLDLVTPGGLLVQASCSSRVTADAFYDGIFAIARARPVRLREVARTGHAIDHPITFPQGAYLKALFAEVG